MGPPTDTNAHPHCDPKQRVALVHNGTVTNTVELFNETCDRLRAQGMDPEQLYGEALRCPDSDSGAIAFIIGLHLDLGMDTFAAMKAVVSRLEGSWAICLVSAHNPHSLYVARCGCPLLLTKDDHTHSVYVASETVAFMRHANDFVVLEDGDMMELNFAAVEELFRTRKVCRITKVQIRSTPEPHQFWIEKEVFEQPLVARVALQHFKLLRASHELRTIKQALEGVVDVTFDSDEHLVDHELELVSAMDPRDVRFEIPVHGDASLLKKIENRHRINIVAAGSSRHAAQYVATLFQRQAIFDLIETDDPTELKLYRYEHPDSTFIYVSQSGETLDTVKACNMLAERNPNAIKIAMLNNLNTLLDRSCELTMLINIGREMSLASTKAFTVQIMLLMSLLGYVVQAQDVGSRHEDFLVELKSSIISFGRGLKMVLRSEEQCERIARHLSEVKSMYVIGSGEGHAIAVEGALKLKEVTYMHVEGIAAGAMKHGTLASIDSKLRTPVICVMTPDEPEVTVNAVKQLKARGAYIILLASNAALAENVADEFIQLPSCGMLTAACAIVPIQMIAYKICILKGRNPDTPRGLAKTGAVHGGEDVVGLPGAGADGARGCERARAAPGGEGAENGGEVAALQHVQIKLGDLGEDTVVESLERRKRRGGARVEPEGGVEVEAANERVDNGGALPGAQVNRLGEQHGGGHALEPGEAAALLAPLGDDALRDGQGGSAQHVAERRLEQAAVKKYGVTGAGGEQLGRVATEAGADLVVEPHARERFERRGGAEAAARSRRAAASPETGASGHAPWEHRAREATRPGGRRGRCDPGAPARKNGKERRQALNRSLARLEPVRGCLVGERSPSAPRRVESPCAARGGRKVPDARHRAAASQQIATRTTHLRELGRLCTYRH
ncbi:glucosamine--fructose-6-phosphate aminotransferase [Babesia caballi]|uniref:glutamine--fructose-6-phosphate transaminase (isomerizing) n=1 Tax=Babesia caballi TaxID=5871 RepID=A0AAV4M1W5_BABCB|nr:glucosamine--fructose-6-phosphate aminotransferase [Babesia caballi]